MAGLDSAETAQGQQLESDDQGEHADVIEEGCRDRLAHAWRLEGVEV